MTINPIKAIRKIIDDIRYAFNDPNSKLNNCSELDQQLRDIEKQLKDGADAPEIDKESEQ